MSEMSYLEKLLDGVEVEWLPLGEVSALRRGRVMSKGYLTENFGPYPVYSSQTANNGKIGSINTFDFDGEYISWTTDGANAGTVFYRTGKFSITNVCGLITLKSKYPLIYKFLFYWLTIEAKKHVYSGMGNPKLMSHQVENIPVPIPCPDNPEKSLAIQSEIVRILDKFTELTAELTAELTMRKKQYNYYLDQSLSFKEGEVELKTLGEMGTLIRGKRFVKSDIIPKGVPCIHYGEMYTHYRIWADKAKSYISVELASKLRKASCGDVVFVSAGETIADIGRGTAWLGDEDVVIHDACFFYKSSLNPKYVAYFSRTNFFHDQIKKSISSGKISAINAKGFEKVIIPVPSPEEQARIVAFLDKFDTLTSSITEGLPREIELRQKQYEYYRDLLFSFPKPETVSN
ncbi:TPA: restriction endonuclease subunit S [Escherichia coli]|nr:restriction endonuclease subunit S [Escherichia coli]HDX4511413.1 restriction endonuclease subunit S [Escherichia coli]